MTRILYIPEGIYMSYYHEITVVFEKVNVNSKYKNNIEAYLEAVITACNNSDYVRHIWGLPITHTKFLRSEFEIIYD